LGVPETFSGLKNPGTDCDDMGLAWVDSIRLHRPSFKASIMEFDGGFDALEVARLFRYVFDN